MVASGTSGLTPRGAPSSRLPHMRREHRLRAADGHGGDFGTLAVLGRVWARWKSAGRGGDPPPELAKQEVPHGLWGCSGRLRGCTVCSAEPRRKLSCPVMRNPLRRAPMFQCGRGGSGRGGGRSAAEGRRSVFMKVWVEDRTMRATPEPIRCELAWHGFGQSLSHRHDAPGRIRLWRSPARGWELDGGPTFATDTRDRNSRRGTRA